MKKFVNNKNDEMKGPEKIKDGSEIENWTPGNTPAIPQDDDKIIDFMRGNFSSQWKSHVKTFEDFSKKDA